MPKATLAQATSVPDGFFHVGVAGFAREGLHQLEQSMNVR